MIGEKLGEIRITAEEPVVSLECITHNNKHYSCTVNCALFSEIIRINICRHAKRTSDLSTVFPWSCHRT